ncbi:MULTISPECIES: alpha/beta fold hydrolase [unclassified Pseudomonas]|uniref:alpha/beta hydrolase family protein n=1 Tax=unclassified Pseudomonas TaxID=196821 RepID=UPI002892E139|nr:MULTISPECIES: alpha/beta fold hydrolase [unclassified Pseudomonas]
MKKSFGALLLICLSSYVFADTRPVGFQYATLADPHNERPLEMVVWYPSANSDATPQLFGDNPVFVGAPAVLDAPAATGEHPLVVLSHGYGGSWINQTWLASALAHQGYIVAAVNHPGTTSRDRSPHAAAQLWQRPVDLSRAIDAVTAQPGKFGTVAKDRIAVIGHSLGGWTVLESGGARFDPKRFADDCKVQTQLISCTAYQQMNTESTAQAKAQLAADWRDKRITAVVSLDLGLSRGMTDASLAAYPVPILVIATGVPSKELPAQLESVDLAKRLPKTSSRLVEISDASHFTFMAICKPGAVAMLDKDVPGDSIICTDGEGGRPRAEIQQQVISLITGFLTPSPDRLKPAITYQEPR